MNRTRKAVLSAGFAYAQYGMGLISGLVLFPLIVRKLGAYDIGLWLATGEAVGYVMLGDLGVFTVLPWIVAARDGAGDRLGVCRHLSEALAIGVVIAGGLAGVAVGLLFLDPSLVGSSAPNWEKVRLPLAMLLGFTAASFSLYPFRAVLLGLQDIAFVGTLNLLQVVLSFSLTVVLLASGAGMIGLALANGAPPFVICLAAFIRVCITNRDLVRKLVRPTWTGCRGLLREGLGAWLGSIGVRLMMATNGLILAGVGRPDWTTMLAATGKAPQSAQPLCGIVADSGLVGLSQLSGKGSRERTRQIVICLVWLYFLVPSAAAIILLIANPVFVHVWLSPDLYAGHYTSALLSINLLFVSIAGGVFKIGGVLGYRLRIGSATVLAGVVYILLGHFLCKDRGPLGLAEASIITSLGLLIPFGVFLLNSLVGLSFRDFSREIIFPWGLRCVPFFVVATVAGIVFAGTGLTGLLISALLGLSASCIYVFIMGSVLAELQWPANVIRWLSYLNIGPKPIAGQDAPQTVHLDAVEITP